MHLIPLEALGRGYAVRIGDCRLDFAAGLAKPHRTLIADISVSLLLHVFKLDQLAIGIHSTSVFGLPSVWSAEGCLGIRTFSGSTFCLWSACWALGQGGASCRE